jgi:hypothetical protein
VCVFLLFVIHLTHLYIVLHYTFIISYLLHFLELSLSCPCVVYQYVQAKNKNKNKNKKIKSNALQSCSTLALLSETSQFQISLVTGNC